MSDCQRVALISEGATGLGRAVVESLASGGWRVVFTHSRNKPQAIELAHRLFVRGFEVAYVEAQLSDSEQRRWAVASTIARFDRLDALVLIPEITTGTSWANADANDWRQVYEEAVIEPMLLFTEAFSSLEKTAGCCIGVMPKPIQTRDSHLLSLSAVAGLRGALSGLAGGLQGRVRVHDLAFDPERTSRPAVAGFVSHLVCATELEGRSFQL